MAGQMRATKLAHDAVHSDDRDKVRLSEGVRQAKDAINAVPFLGGGRLVSVRFASAAFDYGIAHGLGFPAAFMVIRQNYEQPVPAGPPAFMGVTESAAATQATIAPDQAKLIGLRSTAAGTCDIWFYPRASKPIPNGALQSP